MSPECVSEAAPLESLEKLIAGPAAELMTVDGCWVLWVFLHVVVECCSFFAKVIWLRLFLVEVFSCFVEQFGCYICWLLSVQSFISLMLALLSNNMLASVHLQHPQKCLKLDVF